MPSRRRTVFAVTLATALVFVPTAAAKIWFGSIGGKTVATGSVVATEIAGCPVPCPLEGVRVYLATGARSAASPSPSPTRLLATVDRSGIVRFRIPAVASGSYHLVARFKSNWLPASKGFRIVRRR